MTNQTKQNKNKLYIIHAPEVDCISRGKYHKHYKFGCKVSMVTFNRGNCVFGIQAHQGNPYRGCKLKSTLEKAEEMSHWKGMDVNVDTGSTRYDYLGRAKLKIANQYKMKSKVIGLVKWVNSGAIEPIFGHLKNHNRHVQNLLRAQKGEPINEIMEACRFNLRKLNSVFLLPILEWSKNRLPDKYFFFMEVRQKSHPDLS